MSQIEKRHFQSNDIQCTADLYRPDREPPYPAVIMAHGFAAERNFGLAPYAERFAAQGCAVFVFDYRNFGESSGEPRNYVHPWRHLADWNAAIDHVRTVDGIDPRRICLWGTSFSGGHVLVTAAKRDDIAAVIAQVPYLSGLATLKTKSLSDIGRATVLGTLDFAGAAVGRRPIYVPVIAKPGTFAAMNTLDAWDGYQALVPPETSWENAVPARSLILLLMYNPIFKVSRVKAPVLLMYGDADRVTPANAARKAAKRIPDCESHDLACGHFDPYRGKEFEENMAHQSAFLERTVLKNQPL